MKLTTIRRDYKHFDLLIYLSIYVYIIVLLKGQTVPVTFPIKHRHH